VYQVGIAYYERGEFLYLLTLEDVKFFVGSDGLLPDNKIL
jgi:hypothetical protein